MELKSGAQSSFKNNNFVDTSKKLLKNRNKTFPYFTISHEKQSLS